MPAFSLSSTHTPSVSPAIRSSSPIAARCPTAQLAVIPPAHSPITCDFGEPVIASTASSPSITAET